MQDSLKISCTRKSGPRRGSRLCLNSIHTQGLRGVIVQSVLRHRDLSANTDLRAGCATADVGDNRAWDVADMLGGER